jgi:DtxR family manganese transport transcriptional regulator
MGTLQRSQQRHCFLRTRTDHQTERTEDYLEAILDELEHDGRAQLTEIAHRMGVKHPTAAKALKKLAERKLIEIEPYRGVRLTRQGKKLATVSRERHRIVYAFLRLLGLDKKTAELDAEGIEHHVSPKTIAAMKRLLGHGEH